MRALVLAAALLVSACAYGPTVRTDFDPAANFHAYRSYSWVDTAVPQGMNPLMFARVRASIDQALAARGYTHATPGDFAISFTIEVIRSSAAGRWRVVSDSMVHSTLKRAAHTRTARLQDCSGPF